jgi:hypothetical protein
VSNRTYICTACRSAKRAEAAGGLKTDLRCSSCGGTLWELSHRWRIPKKTDKKAWAELAEIVAQSGPAREAFIMRRGHDKLATVDHLIEAFSARKPSDQREAALKELSHERRQILRMYFEGGIDLEPSSSGGTTNSEQDASSNGGQRSSLNSGFSPRRG